MSSDVDEDHVLEQVTTRLEVRFPQIDKARLRTAASEAVHGFDDAHVRDFVPVLAERAAAEALSRS